ncbi:translation initiation factor IF-3 [Candidatus Berkelbacteria bacterium CG10_big_fil_rev_8_21_14_0_10_41_12]|uniref:Translation initiation factor IF-3 n=1 Tax=Candidatus Berkelbacteria bacterium CG10_big_fil_rev_8_21_14_0_10_41_12 TaxID=1974513 RepID=A0A2M6WWS8_9BACT|nr:MAG: translation initiation factor IF-3 [Candidatus Berkelbacteria bacterium CG10_big_fil_rev_8_21_14_0_10_41_12]
MIRHRVNEYVRAPKVLLIDEEGKSVGEISRDEALKTADERGYDLVEINPNSNPPICKLLDYGKFRYELKKAQKNQKSQAGKVKEIRLSGNIEDHDFQTKVERAKEFLEKGNKVRISVKLLGRQMAFQSRAYEQLDRVKDALETKYETPPTKLGNIFSAIVVLDKDKKNKEENEQQS